ncbi:hypothetical protein ACQ4PT_055093 [Festuca glaucescens]
MPSPRRRSASEVEPGHPSNRPGEVYSSSLSTPAIEVAATEMRRTHLAVLVSDPRLNISTRSIAKALQERLDFPWEDIHVSASFPDDFLVRFAQPWQRDVALDEGTVLLRHGSLALTTWSPTARGRPQTWRFYCRLALENIPLNAWEDELTVKAVLGGACELDRVERRSILRDNTAALFVWAWCLDLDLIPKIKPHSILGRPAERRQDLPEGTPAEEGRDGPLYRILIHLDKVIDYTPLDEGRRGVQWPQVYRKDWAFGVEDGKPGPRTRPTRDRLGPSSHSRRRDEDWDGDHDGRNSGSRRGERRGGEGGDIGDSSLWSSERHHHRQDRHDRRPSRTPDRLRRGDSSRHRSRSAGPAEQRGTEAPPSEPAPSPTDFVLQPSQMAVLQPGSELPNGNRSRIRRSRSRTAEGSSAWGSTPSPPPGSIEWPCLPSPMQLSPPVEGHAAVMAASPYELHFPSPDNLVQFSACIPAPPSPLIPWEDLQSFGQPCLGAVGFEDRWSANITPGAVEEPLSDHPASPPHLRSPLHSAPEQLAVDQWADFFAERSGDFVPSQHSVLDWHRIWSDEPVSGPCLGLDQMMYGAKQPQMPMGEYLFGPGALEQAECASDSSAARVLTVPEKIVLEVDSGRELPKPRSPGWQLQDIFATPTAPLASRASSSSSEGLDDAALQEVTLK